jgi:hypothetical protein
MRTMHLTHAELGLLIAACDRYAAHLNQLARELPPGAPAAARLGSDATASTALATRGIDTLHTPAPTTPDVVAQLRAILGPLSMDNQIKALETLTARKF